MAAGGKYDYPPLLAPGRHSLSLQDIQAICIHPFEGRARDCRERLFFAFEQLVQNLLLCRLPCEVFANGSFFTRKPMPDDIDVIVSIDLDVSESLTFEQRELVDSINGLNYITGLDCFAYVSYPRGHEGYGTELDAGVVCKDYGIEHGETWLKGYVVIRVWETNVGLRLYR